MLTELQRKVLSIIADYMKENGVYLGGGTALTLKYSHRASYDLDLFSWTVDRERFFRDMFGLLSGFNRIVLEPIIVVEDPETGQSLKIELHRRGKDVKLLGYEVVDGIPVLSDEDILGEKLYHGRCAPRDIFDVSFLLQSIQDPVNVLKKKYREPVDLILTRLKRNCPQMYRLISRFAAHHP
ncbi:MAG: nucleotidyl transferase AbiEii/AbiGii toxin family protein [Candidatus Diapherotrites archaeon]|nr:nucleotidyl transferase AbiEii/AbiGii toxin family protein [Candidatus Diapherotrites archaeon]